MVSNVVIHGIDNTPGDSNNLLHVSSHTKNGITIFIACANTGSSNRIMTSYDGYTWNTETTGNYDYRCIASEYPLQELILVKH